MRLMNNIPPKDDELHDWVDALENLILFNGRDDASELIQNFVRYVGNKGLLEPGFTALPYDNSISQYEESDYPGDWELEEKIRHDQESYRDGLVKQTTYSAEEPHLRLQTDIALRPAEKFRQLRTLCAVNEMFGPHLQARRRQATYWTPSKAKGNLTLKRQKRQKRHSTDHFALHYEFTGSI